MAGNCAAEAVFIEGGGKLNSMPNSTKLNSENLSVVLDAIPVPVFVKDSASRFVAMNNACEDQWGISFASIEMTDGRDFFPKDQLAGFIEKDREIFRGGKAVHFEEQYWNHKLQQNRTSRTSKSPTYDAAGNPDLLICVLVDITAQKEAMDSLRHSEEKLRSLYELAPLGIALTTMSGKYIEFNEAFSRICGYSQDELSQLDYWQLTPPEYAQQEAAQLEAMASTGRYGPYFKEYIHKSGARVPLRLNGMLVTGIDGKPLIWSIVEDVSEQKRAEERLAQSQKLEAVGHLTAGIAHDFNNLLSIILGNVELIAEQEEISNTARQRLAKAIAAIERGSDLTQRLLSFSSRQALSPALIDLGVEVKEVAAMLRRMIPESISFEIKTTARPVPVRVDKNQLGNALINLVVNARDAMKAGGSILIGVDIKDVDDHPSAVVSIRDTGCGMTPEVLSKAFDPFFTTKEVGQGSGLGLSMVYGFMRQSNGETQLSSTVGQGTLVELLFPMAAGERPVPASPATPAAAAAQRRRVLVVDDMADVRLAVSEQLASLSCDVTEAADGPGALAVLKNDHGFDLLLTDLGLPGGMGGLQLAEAVSAAYPRIKIMTMSGYNSPEVWASANSRPEWKPLHKPFRRSILAEAMKEAFGAAKAAPPDGTSAWAAFFTSMNGCCWRRSWSPGPLRSVTRMPPRIVDPIP